MTGREDNVPTRKKESTKTKYTTGGKRGTGDPRAEEQVEHIRAGQTIAKAGKHKAGSKTRRDMGEQIDYTIKQEAKHKSNTQKT